MVYGEGARDIAIIDVLSRAYLGTGNYDAALTVVRDYARSDVADEHKLKVFLDVLRLLDQTEPEKQRVYEELNAVGPASDDLFIHYALLCRCLGASAEALEHIRSARQSSHSATLLVAMGLVLDDLNEGAASLNLLQEAERAADAPPYASKFTRSATRDLDHVRRMREYADSRASNCDKPKVAIMISGFVRDYHAAYALRSFVERHPGWAVDVFAHMFDRMGDFRIPFGMPKELYDYTNGGVFREIQKTAPLNTEKFMDFFQPTRCVIEERREDGYYNDLIGMAHPQWLKVFKCFELLENYISETGVRYDAAIRARPDTSYATLTLSPGKVSEGQVIVPGNHNYGMPGYTICDRFAYSTVNTIRTYCMIGAGKTFVALEKEDTWQQHLAAASHSHETHLAYWLMKNKIQVIRDLNLIV